MQRKLDQLTWLYRRIQFASPKEIVFRTWCTCRLTLQQFRKFRYQAKLVKTPIFGNSWVSLPGTHKICPNLEEKLASIFNGEIDLLGRKTCVQEPIQWNRAVGSNIELSKNYGPLLDFRHLNGIDIKHLWELNRHLWLVPLAQAYALSEDAKYLEKLYSVLNSWLENCKYPNGPNWSSPVEHGIRLVNWSIIWHLIGGESSSMFRSTEGARFRATWLDSIERHLIFITQNYSKYSSADNHLIGEASGVFIGSLTWQVWIDCERWICSAQRILEDEVMKQFAEDGVNLEQSTCYHKLSLEFALAAGICARSNTRDFDNKVWNRIHIAATFLGSIMLYDGTVPAVGDGDDSRVLGLEYVKNANPYKSILLLVGHLLAQPSLIRKGKQSESQIEWLVPRLEIQNETPCAYETSFPQTFKVGGYIILGSGLHTKNETRVLFDVGSLGLNGIAGHGHADALSLLLSYGSSQLLVDSGTYCYQDTLPHRRYYRGTKAHNTVTVDDLDQAKYGGPFLWLTNFNVKVEHQKFGKIVEIVRASHDGYTYLQDPVHHTRQVTLNKENLTLHVEDYIHARELHQVSIRWHFHPDCKIVRIPNGVSVVNGNVRMALTCSSPILQLNEICPHPGQPFGWISPNFNVLSRAPTIAFNGSLNRADRVITSIKLSKLDDVVNTAVESENEHLV
jgi:hypothetical protein